MLLLLIESYVARTVIQNTLKFLKYSRVTLGPDKSGEAMITYLRVKTRLLISRGWQNINENGIACPTLTAKIIRDVENELLSFLEV